MIYRIYEENVRGLLERLEKLNRRAVKLGAPAISWRQTGEEFEEIEGEPGKKRRLVLFDVEGNPPKYNGWTFMAVLNHTSEGNVLRSVPGIDLPMQYRDRSAVCDHCQTNRLRRDTYIVRHDDGTWKQVGSTCLHDFLGHEDPSKLAALAELVIGAFEIFSGSRRSGGGGVFFIDLPSYLAFVAQEVIDSGKFVTRRIANETQTVSTSTIAYNMMFPASGRRVEPSEKAYALAEAARSFVLDKYAPHLADGVSPEQIKVSMLNYFGRHDQLSDFEHNLLVVARCEGVEPRQAGIAAYIVEAYRRAQPKPQIATLNMTGLEVILGMFKSATANLKHPAIRLANPEGTYLHLSLASAASKNAGCIYVKGDLQDRHEDADGNFPQRPYFGKITPQARFFPAQECPPDAEAMLLEFAADPENIASKYGKLTGCCCFCGRRLTDARSTEVGYGPVCAERFGRTWGALKVAATTEPVAAAV